MYIFQNALKNLARNKNRNILLAAVIFAVIAATAATLSIVGAADRMIGEYKNQFGTEVTISRDMVKYFTAAQRGEAIPAIAPERYAAFADSDLIQKSVLVNSASCVGHDLAAVGETGSGMVGSGYVADPNMMLLGDNWADFANGYRVLTDGAMPENIDECIVDSEFAALNGIREGDAIRLYGMVPSQDEGTIEPTIYDLTVTGVYRSAADVDKGAISWSGPLLNRHNEILTVYDTIDLASAGVAVTATYYLKKPEYLEDFDNELRAKGLDGMFDVNIDAETYNAVVGPLEGMRGVSATFMTVVLALGAAIIIVLSSVAVRERKYEIGVLRAMGMKKTKVALGMWSEIMFITAFCLCVGLGAGAPAAQPVSDSLLKKQIADAQKIKDLGGGFFSKEIGGATKTVEDDPIDSLNVSLGAVTVLEIAAIALLLASLAGLTAIVGITQYEPLRILMERN